MSKTYCYQWSQSAIQIWCRSSRESILSLKNPKDTAEGCSMTPLLPLNSYYTNRTHKCSIYKILLQDLYFLREFFEVHRELTIHYNNANVTNRLLIFFSHRKINTKSLSIHSSLWHMHLYQAFCYRKSEFLVLTIFSCCQGNTAFIFLQLKTSAHSVY